MKWLKQIVVKTQTEPFFITMHGSLYMGKKNEMDPVHLKKSNDDIIKSHSSCYQIFIYFIHMHIYGRTQGCYEYLFLIGRTISYYDLNQIIFRIQAS